MAKRAWIFVVLMWPISPAAGQVVSGTIIVFNFAKDRLVVAADSRGVNTDTGVPHDTECKIATYGRRLVFTSAGNARRIPIPGVDPIDGWDNAETTKAAFRSAMLLPSHDADLGLVAANWADTIVANWQSFYSHYPDKVERLVSPKGGLTVGAFAEADRKTIQFKEVQINLDRDEPQATNAIAPELREEISDCWECGAGNRVCALGKHLDAVAKFCSERNLEAKIKLRTHLQKADQAAKLAVKIAEVVIDLYGKTPGDVGGDVDAVTLRSDGAIIWNSLKDRCQKSRD